MCALSLRRCRFFTDSWQIFFAPVHESLTIDSLAVPYFSDRVIAKVLTLIEGAHIPSNVELRGWKYRAVIYSTYLSKYAISSQVVRLQDEDSHTFRILVPSAILDLRRSSLHAKYARSGAEKLQKRLAKSVFWPNIKKILLYLWLVSPEAPRNFYNL